MANDEQLNRGVWPDIEKYGTNKMYYHHTFLPHSKGRTRALAAMAAATAHEESGIASASAAARRDIYTFGVYTGSSCKFWHERLPLVGTPYVTQWGFDSFEGLPIEAEGMVLENKAWLPGAFSAADKFDVTTWAQCQAKLNAHVLGDKAEMHDKVTSGRLDWIKGFYSDSLTPSLAADRQMRAALLVDCDVDLYISAAQCLTWLFASGIIVPGTFVYYDDVGTIKADRGGELKAHEEATETYGVTWHKFSDDLWRCIAIARPPASL